MNERPLLTADEDACRSPCDAEFLASRAAEANVRAMPADHVHRSLSSRTVRQTADAAVNTSSVLPVVVGDSCRMAVAKCCSHCSDKSVESHCNVDVGVQASSGSMCVPPTNDACRKSVQSVAVKSEPQSVGLSVASDDVVIKSEKDVKGPAKEHAEPSSSSVTENSKKKRGVVHALPVLILTERNQNVLLLDYRDTMVRLYRS